MANFFNTIKDYIIKNAEYMDAAVIFMNGGDYYLNV